MSKEISTSEAQFLWELMPKWVKEQPEGLDPTMYGRGSAKADEEVKKLVLKILGLNKP